MPNEDQAQLDGSGTDVQDGAAPEDDGADTQDAGDALVNEGDVVFMDPSELPESMLPLWKSMQDKFADSMRVIKDSESKLAGRLEALEARLSTQPTDRDRPQSDTVDGGSSSGISIQIPPDLEWARGPLESIAKQLSDQVKTQVAPLNQVKNSVAYVTKNLFEIQMSQLWPEWKEEANNKAVIDEIKRDPRLVFDAPRAVQLAKAVLGKGGGGGLPKATKTITKPVSTSAGPGLAGRRVEVRQKAKNLGEAFDMAWNELDKKGQIPRELKGG